MGGEHGYLVPVGGRTPVILDEVRTGLVGHRLNGDGVVTGPVHGGAEIAHRAQGQFDVRLRDDVARQAQFQSLAQRGTNHQQGRDELRTGVAGYFHIATLKPLSGDEQRRKTRIARIADVGT